MPPLPSTDSNAGAPVARAIHGLIPRTHRTLAPDRCLDTHMNVVLIGED